MPVLTYFWEKETCCMIYTYFALMWKYLSFTGYQYYQRPEEKSKVRPQNQKLDCLYLFPNLFGTHLIFMLFHFHNDCSFIMLKNISRKKSLFLILPFNFNTETLQRKTKGYEFLTDSLKNPRISLI